MQIEYVLNVEKTAHSSMEFGYMLFGLENIYAIDKSTNVKFYIDDMLLCLLRSTKAWMLFGKELESGNIFKISIIKKKLTHMINLH